MCSPSPPKPAPVVAPPPPAEQAKPLGVDDQEWDGGIAALRTSGRNGLSIRAASRTGAASTAGFAIASGSGTSSGQPAYRPPSGGGRAPFSPSIDSPGGD